MKEIDWQAVLIAGFLLASIVVVGLILRNLWF